MLLAPMLLLSRTQAHESGESGVGALRLWRMVSALSYCLLLLASCLLCLGGNGLYRQEAEAMIHKPTHMDALMRATGIDRKPAHRQAANAAARRPGTTASSPATGVDADARAAAGGFEARLQELVGDPALREGNLGAIEKLLDMDAGLFAESEEDATPFEDALMGAMNLRNAEAIATVTEMLEQKARREGKTGLAAMPDAERSLERLVTTKSVGSPLASVTMPLNRTPLNLADMEHGVSSMPGNPSVRMALQSVPVDGPVPGETMLAQTLSTTPIVGLGNVPDPDVTRALAAYARTQGGSRSVAQASARRTGPAVPAATAAPTHAASRMRDNPSAQQVAAVQEPNAQPGGAPATTVRPDAAIRQVAPPSVAQAQEPVRTPKPYRAPHLDVTGVIAARFESGHHGIAAIGYDRRGGTSYGKYQISSRRGSMHAFLDYLDNSAPDLSERLRTSGPANTGSRAGGMPMEWKRIAAEYPTRFRDLQDEFIHRANYRPALQNILEETNINIGNSSPALREVLWSTAVQHGPKGAADIFVNATRIAGASNGHGPASVQEKKLIEAVYDERKGRFHGSSRRVRHAVRTRLELEKDFALSLLGKASASL